MEMPHFTTAEVRDAILACKSSYSCGPDGCPSKFLKLFPELCTPQASLFNVNQLLVLDAWRLAYVIPIFKGKGSKLLVENYRPISLTSIFSMVMESLIRKKIVDFFDANNLFAQSQWGLDLAGLRCLS